MTEGSHNKSAKKLTIKTTCDLPAYHTNYVFIARLSLHTGINKIRKTYTTYRRARAKHLSFNLKAFSFTTIHFECELREVNCGVSVVNITRLFLRFLFLNLLNCLVYHSLESSTRCTMVMYSNQTANLSTFMSAINQHHPSLSTQIIKKNHSGYQ